MLARLRDGGRVVIRPIRPSDRQLLERSRGRFSDESMRRRFLGPKPRLNTTELRYLTEVDGQNHVAFVATLVDDLDAIVAVARRAQQVLGRPLGSHTLVAGPIDWHDAGE